MAIPKFAGLIGKANMMLNNIALGIAGSIWDGYHLSVDLDWLTSYEAGSVNTAKKSEWGEDAGYAVFDCMFDF